MLMEIPKKRIVARVMDGPDGKPIIAVFVVARIHGSYFVKLISTREIQTGQHDVCLLNESHKLECGVCRKIPHSDAIVSPYISLDFFVSQMTRAPSKG
ncbi:MAG: hypothetical protein A3H58_03575 [Candidatus Taylorbacteria bacterium RIFCSPLOWO2_02_FULL_43_22b]|nr:MAG: hypothetical protein A3B09_02800 [Candidatus Taylorbacteria bacterium RIFCSPLOWO2_01_FULL_43_83]OHA39787.1 MAG: hypothetical protein A3H58_03575 [Candidatus Taylorbacteria bacterium RIFCSPLOWO2_02_FULL_43_22b]